MSDPKSKYPRLCDRCYVMLGKPQGYTHVVQEKKAEAAPEGKKDEKQPNQPTEESKDEDKKKPVEEEIEPGYDCSRQDRPVWGKCILKAEWFVEGEL